MRDISARLRENADLDEMEHCNPDVVALEREAADTIDQLRGRIAELEAQQRAGVPDGWKLVPVEPTPEMFAAANASARSEYAMLGLTDASRIDATKAAGNYYRAMLSAAPSPEGQEAMEQGGGKVVAWRVPVVQSPFGERLDHGVRDELVLVMHRGTHGWKAAGQGHALLAHQLYVKNVEPLCAASHEVAVVGLSGGGWRTVWARSDDDVTHPAPPSAPEGQEAEGEDIMVNTPYDVFTLPLQPSGLSSGPRFVVHVPGPEQPAAQQAQSSTEAWRELAIAGAAIVEEIREIVGLKGKPGDVVEAVRELAAAQQQQPVAVDEALDRMLQAPSRLWMADLIGQKISVGRMREILAFALATQHQEQTT